MLFQKRVDRVMEYSRKKSGKKKKETFQKGQEKEFLADYLEKGDLPALIISALMVLLPVAMIVIFFMCFIGMLPAFF